MKNLILINTLIALAYAEGDGVPESTTPPENKGTPKTFTQEDVNRLVAEEKRKLTGNQSKLLSELETIKQKANLTVQERDELNTRIEQIQSESMTKSELAAQREAKLKKDSEDKIIGLTNESQTWRNRYTKSTIQRSITDAASKEGAYSSDQVIAILEQNTQLVDVLGEDNKPTGEHVVIVKYKDKGKDGKPVTLDLPVDAAIKKMKEDTNFQNLFKGTGTGGMGSSNRGGGNSGSVDLARLAKEDPAAYREARKKLGL